MIYQLLYCSDVYLLVLFVVCVFVVFLYVVGRCGCVCYAVLYKAAGVVLYSSGIVDYTCGQSHDSAVEHASGATGSLFPKQ